jgi:phosphoribosylformimino-5-aminoimidazole carboxamide ribotide isomerase
MKVIPVLDIKNGTVVHGLAGQRNEYKPVRSILFPEGSADPFGVLDAFVEKLGITNIYIADLDSLEKRGDNFSLIGELKKKFPEIEFMVDGGFTRYEDIENTLTAGIDRVVIATESLTTMKLLADLENLGYERFICSLDFMGEQFVFLAADEQERSPRAFIEKLADMGLNTFILLDVAMVGTGTGIRSDFLKLRSRFPKQNFITGGGVKDFNDAMHLKEAGFDGLLLATSLHNGRIGRNELTTLQEED